MDPERKPRDWTWALCLVVALALVWPRWSTGADVMPGVPPVDAIDSTYTLARMAETLNGHASSGNSLLLEHAGDPVTKGSFWDPLLGYVGRILGLDIVALYWLVTLAGTSIGLFCLSRLTRELGVRAPLDIGIAAAVLAFTLDQRIFRVVQPQWTWPLFVAWILWFLRWSRRPSRCESLWLAGLTVVQVWSYPHFAVMSVGALVLYGLWSVLRRQSGAGALGFVGLACLAAIPQVLNLREILGHEAHADLVWRMGFAVERPVLPLTWGALAALLAVSRFERTTSTPLLCLALAALVGANLQLVTGHDVASARYVWYLMRPLGAVIGLCLAVTWFDLKKGVVIGLTTGLVAMSVVRVSTSTDRWFEARSEAHAALRRFEPAFEALKELPGRVVIACGADSIGAWIPALTGHRIYSSQMAHTQLLTRDQYEKRQHEAWLLSGRSLPDLVHGWEKDPSLPAAVFFGNHYHFVYGGNQHAPRKECERVILDHATWVRGQDAGWQPAFHCDYVLLTGDPARWPVVEGERVAGPDPDGIDPATCWSLIRRTPR